MHFNRAKFFAGYRTEFGSLTQSQVDAIEALLAFFEADGTWNDIRWIAYALATIYHETAHTFEPIYEYGPRSYFNKYDPEHNPRKAKDLGNTKPGDGYRYRGAGFVQLTGRKNFAKFGIEDTPQLALDPQTAFNILTVGMMQGSYTSKKLSDYISGNKCDYVNARRIINGTDKAARIAGYAEDFEKILKAAKITPPAFADLSDGEVEELLDIPTTSTAIPPIPATEAAADTISELQSPATGQPENSPSIDLAKNSEGLQQTAASTSVELTPGGLKAQSDAATVEQNVVIEKRENMGFFASIWKKITGLAIFNGGIEGISNQAQQVQALGLTMDFWQRIGYLVLGASVIYLAFEGYKHWSRIKEEKERDAILARENSTPTNFVQFVDKEALPIFKAKGYKVITR